MQLGQTEEAETELLALTAHGEASLGMCMEAFAALLGKGRAEALKSAADLIIERFKSSAYVPVKLAELILGQKEEVCDPAD